MLSLCPSSHGTPSSLSSHLPGPSSHSSSHSSLFAEASASDSLRQQKQSQEVFLSHELSYVIHLSTLCSLAFPLVTKDELSVLLIKTTTPLANNTITQLEGSMFQKRLINNFMGENILKIYGPVAHYLLRVSHKERHKAVVSNSPQQVFK